MNNKDEELIFDFMAAAEDTGKRLDSLIKVIPGSLQKILSAEYQRSPWLATLPMAVERLNIAVKSTESAAARTESATERTESTATQAIRKVKTVCVVACIAAIIMPLATWGLAYWQTSNLRDEQAALKAEAERLQQLAAALEDETGGGVLLEKDNSGKRYVRLPVGAEVDRDTTQMDASVSCIRYRRRANNRGGRPQIMSTPSTQSGIFQRRGYNGNANGEDGHHRRLYPNVIRPHYDQPEEFDNHGRCFSRFGNA